MSGYEFLLADVRGREIDLLASDILLSHSPALFGLPPKRVPATSGQALHGGPGAPSIRNVSHDVRRFPIPFRVRGDSPGRLLESIRKLGRAVDAFGDGYCSLMVTDHLGVVRELRMQYEYGLDQMSISMCDSQAETVTAWFVATDPYWHRHTVPQVSTVADNSGWVSIGAGVQRCVMMIPYDGTAPSWPVWDIRGPLDRIVVRSVHGDSERVWALDADALGSTICPDTVHGISVQTAPGSVRVRRALHSVQDNDIDGAPADHYIEDDYPHVSWPLVGHTGERNQIIIDVEGGSEATAVNLSWTVKDLQC